MKPQFIEWFEALWQKYCQHCHVEVIFYFPGDVLLLLAPSLQLFQLLGTQPEFVVLSQNRRPFLLLRLCLSKLSSPFNSALSKTIVFDNFLRPQSHVLSLPLASFSCKSPPPTSLFIADLGTRCQRPGLPFSIFSPDAVLIFHRQAENSVVYQSYGARSERLPLSHDPNQSELLSNQKLSHVLLHHLKQITC